MLVKLRRKPVIGVSCIDSSSKMNKKTHSCIRTNYVKYLQLAGAEVVPIWINRPRAYYEQILSRVNGVFIPGGAVFVKRADAMPATLTNHCVQTVAHILEIALAQCKAGKRLPIWGTCLGFQLLVLLSSNARHATADDSDPRQEIVPMRQRLPVRFCNDFRTSRETSFGQHQHRYCITAENLQTWQFKPSVEWQPLATNADSEGREFVSIIECRHYPFYGCQIHPECVLFEESKCERAQHAECVQAAAYFGRFFVQECWRNENCFPSEVELKRHLIGNFEDTIVAREQGKLYYEFSRSCDYPATTLTA